MVLDLRNTCLLFFPTRYDATYPFQPTHLVSTILVSTVNPTESPRTSSTSQTTVPAVPTQRQDRNRHQSRFDHHAKDTKPYRLWTKTNFFGPSGHTGGR